MFCWYLSFTSWEHCQRPVWGQAGVRGKHRRLQVSSWGSRYTILDLSDFKCAWCGSGSASYLQAWSVPASKCKAESGSATLPPSTTLELMRLKIEPRRLTTEPCKVTQDPWKYLVQCCSCASPSGRSWSASKWKVGFSQPGLWIRIQDPDPDWIRIQSG